MKKLSDNASRANLPQLITKSNALARARWPAKSVLEPRLVALVASKVRQEDEAFKTYNIHISELFGSHYGSADIVELDRAVESIMSYVIEIHENNGDTWTKCNIFARCSFTKSTGLIEVCFHEKLLPHYLQLKQYVQYRLADFLTLPSVYSQRMYEFLKSWASCPSVTVPLVELHEMMDLDEYMRKDFAQFRKKVLERSKSDLKDKLDFDFEWNPVKKGRKVEKIIFTFSSPRVARWKKMREDASREHAARIRTQAVMCVTTHGTPRGGGCQDEQVCQACMDMRNSWSKETPPARRKYTRRQEQRATEDAIPPK